MFCGDHKNRNTTFGLRSGQIHNRQYRIISRADWYSGEGDWLGCGDLTTQDLERIQACLEPGETFFVIEKAHKQEALNRPPGWRRNLHYIYHRCTHVIQGNHRFFINDQLAGFRGTSIRTFYSLVFVVYSRQTYLRQIAAPLTRQDARRASS